MVTLPARSEEVRSMARVQDTLFAIGVILAWLAIFSYVVARTMNLPFVP